MERFERMGTPTLPVRAFNKRLRRRAGPRLIGGEFGRAWRRRSLSMPAEGGLGEVDGKKERVNGASHHYCVCSLIRGTTRSSGNRSRKPSGRLRHGSFRTSRGAPACCSIWRNARPTHVHMTSRRLLRNHRPDRKCLLNSVALGVGVPGGSSSSV